VTLLALDPSTDVTGAAIFREDGSLAAYTSFDAWELTGQPRSRTGLVDRIERIAATRAALAVWLGRREGEGLTITQVAYETQSGRGHASSEALVMAVGNYLTLSRLSRVPLIEINRSAGCAAVGASGVYAQAAGKTATECEAKRARLKAAVICGVNHALGLELRPDQDAEADAIAVGLAATKKLAALEKLKKGRKK
jgi:Holliday junction resolvasome RuvABC endonuclease subunit